MNSQFGIPWPVTRMQRPSSQGQTQSGRAPSVNWNTAAPTQIRTSFRRPGSQDGSTSVLRTGNSTVSTKNKETIPPSAPAPDRDSGTPHERDTAPPSASTDGSAGNHEPSAVPSRKRGSFSGFRQERLSSDSGDDHRMVVNIAEAFIEPSVRRESFTKPSDHRAVSLSEGEISEGSDSVVDGPSTAQTKIKNGSAQPKMRDGTHQSGVTNGAGQDQTTETQPSKEPSPAEQTDAMMEYSNSAPAMESQAMEAPRTTRGDTSNQPNLGHETAPSPQVADEGPPPTILTLAQLTPDDLRLQLRYFYPARHPSTVPATDPVRCLACGVPGHARRACPELTCGHCGARDEHPSVLCPTLARCPRCAARGHAPPNCPHALRPDNLAVRDCALCGHDGHAEAACERVWRAAPPSFARPPLPPPPRVRRSCHECGAAGHLGNDCPRRRPGKPPASSSWSDARVPPVAPPSVPARPRAMPGRAPRREARGGGGASPEAGLSMPKVRPEPPPRGIKFAANLGGDRFRAPAPPAPPEPSGLQAARRRFVEEEWGRQGPPPPPPQYQQRQRRRSRSPPGRPPAQRRAAAEMDAYRPMPSAARGNYMRGRY